MVGTRESQTVRIALAALGLAGCAAFGGDPRPVLTVPQSTPLTESAPIVIRNLEPGAKVTLTLRRADDWQPSRLLSSETRFVADRSGMLDTSKHAPIDGPWRRADPFGPFWSMKRIEGSGEGFAPGEVLVAADVDGDERPDLEATVQLQTGAPLVTTEDFEGFPGATVMRPKGREGERLPAIMVLGGSGGDDWSERFIGPRLAQLGFMVIGLPYHSPAYYGREPKFPELPSTFANLPVDYVGEAITRLRERADLEDGKVALYGTSKGAELVLLAASLLPDDTPGGGFCAVAAIVPSDVVWEGWGYDGEERKPSFSYRGKPLPFVPYIGMDETIARLSKGEDVSFRVPHDKGRAAFPERVEQARIQVERIDEPVFLLGGNADETWDSGGMARNIEATRSQAGLPTVTLTYVGAGHGLSGSGYRSGDEETARARADAYPRLLTFLRRSLTTCQSG